MTHRSHPGRSPAIPAALPHVIGVSALSPTGNVPQFSNRDRIYNDISAPGQEIYSTLPRALTASAPALPEPGVLRLRPGRVPPRGGNVVRRAAGHGGRGHPVRAQPDAAAGSGPEHPRTHSDGRERVERLQAMPAAARHVQRLGTARRREGDRRARGRPAAAGPARAERRRRRLCRPARHKVTSVKATIDFWDDQIDVYRLYLKKNQKVKLTLNGPEGSTSNLLLWKPGTTRVNDLRNQHLRAAQAIGPGPTHGSATRRRRPAGTTRRSSSPHEASARTS